MTLLITLFCAVVSTLFWYNSDNLLRYDILCWMFWGASIMWFVDACFEYAAQGAKCFCPKPSEMLNDAYLGLYIVALALVIWTLFVLIKDPKGVVRARLFNKFKKFGK